MDDENNLNELFLITFFQDFLEWHDRRHTSYDDPLISCMMEPKADSRTIVQGRLVVIQQKNENATGTMLGNR